MPELVTRSCVSRERETERERERESGVCLRIRSRIPSPALLSFAVKSIHYLSRDFTPCFLFVAGDRILLCFFLFFFFLSVQRKEKKGDGKMKSLPLMVRTCTHVCTYACKGRFLDRKMNSSFAADREANEALRCLHTTHVHSSHTHTHTCICALYTVFYPVIKYSICLPQ